MTHVILSYCDTLLKKTQLKELIDTLKTKYPEDKVLVYSHYSGVEPEWYSGSDFYFFDKSNPMSEKTFSDWVRVDPQKKTFYRSGEDWGFAVMQMIKRSLNFLQSIGEREALYLNYDCSCGDILNLDLDKIKSGLGPNDVGGFSWWCDMGISMTTFYIRLDKLNHHLFELIDYDYYMSLPRTMIPEQVWQHIITKSFGNNWVLLDFNISITMSLSSRQLPEGDRLRQYFDTILPTTDSQTGEKALAIWNAELTIETVTLEIDQTHLTYHNQIPEEMRHHSFYTTLPNTKIEKITLLGINDFSIDPYVLDGLDERWWKNNTHHSS